MANAATPKKINWAINAWIIGLIALVVGLTSFGDSFVGGLFYVLIAIITIPKTVSLIANTPKVSFLAKWFVRYPLVFLLFIIAFNAVNEAKEKVLIDDFTKNNASIVAEIKKEIDAGEFSKANKTIAKYKDVLALYKNEDLNKLSELSAQKEEAAKKAKEAKAAAEAKKREAESSSSASSSSSPKVALPSGDFSHFSDGSGGAERVSDEQYHYACNNAYLSTRAIKNVGVEYHLVGTLYDNNPNSVSKKEVFWNSQGQCVGRFTISGMVNGTQYTKTYAGYAEAFTNDGGSIYVTFLDHTSELN